MKESGLYWRESVADGGERRDGPGSRFSPPGGRDFPDSLSESIPPSVSELVGRLPPPPEEARGLWRMRARLLRTVFAQAIRRARFRVAMVVLLTFILWSTLFWLFTDAFRFLASAIPTPDLHDETVQIVFGTFFVTLMVMLVFSASIILYSTLFKGRDIPLLLTLPIRAERVFLSKFQEAIVMSSWAFLLLGSPMLLAYGIVGGAPWHYYAMLVPYLVAFTYVPAGLGAVACLLVVYRLPRVRCHLLGVAAAAVLAACFLSAWSLARQTESNLLTPGWFQDMLDRLRITQHRLLPSWWLSAGLFQAARRESTEGVLFLVLMISNALMFRQVAIWVASRVYRPALTRLYARPTGQHRLRGVWLDRLLLSASRFASRPVQLLMVKDLRLFRRDPMQWSQLLIFTGLLALYFLNVRRFSYDVYYVSWVNLVSFLNVSVVGLLLSTFTTRFIFPMVSLEGRRFWILGLLPIQRDTILWSKFVFAVGVSIVPSSLLILLSDTMLGISPLVMASHQLTCVVLCFGLSGIAVGLGAKLPSLREESPARIAAGFGGTLNLVLSTLYILAVVLLTAVPCHFYLGVHGAEWGTFFGGLRQLQSWLLLWLLAGTVASLALGMLATIVPLALGLRAFRRLEF
jgi:ABC-2 type transport system permease protein